jgi:hypothetical protein
MHHLDKYVFGGQMLNLGRENFFLIAPNGNAFGKDD